MRSQQPDRAAAPQLAGVLADYIVPHVFAGREGQLELAGAAAGQLVQQAGRQSLQALLGKGLRAAHIPQGRHKARAQQAGHLFPALVGEKDQVLAPRGDPADRPRRQSAAGVHQDALPVDQVARGQGSRALHRQVGQRLEEGGAAALVVVKEDHFAGGVQRGVEVLQKELFGAGVGVQGQVHPGHLAALQQAAGRHPAGCLLQSKVAARARRPPQKDHIAGLLAFHAQHKGPAHGPDQGVHIGVLTQHRLLDLSGQPFKAAQVLGRGVGRAPGQQAVGLHVPQQLAAVLQRLFGGHVLAAQGFVLFFQQLVQGLLLFQQGLVQVGGLRPGGGAGRLCGGFCARFGRRLCFLLALAGRDAAGAHPPSGAEHTVHQVFPIVVVAHSGASFSLSQGTAFFVSAFQYNGRGPVWQGGGPKTKIIQEQLLQSTPASFTIYCKERATFFRLQ